MIKISQNFGRAIGELEQEIMEIFWLEGELPIREVVERLNQKKKIAYTTILTIMNRLVDKGLLARKPAGVAYIYKPSVTRQKFLSYTAHRLFSTTVSTLGNEVVAHFVKEIEKLSPKKRKELLKMLDKK